MKIQDPEACCQSESVSSLTPSTVFSLVPDHDKSWCEAACVAWLAARCQLDFGNIGMHPLSSVFERLDVFFVGHDRKIRNCSVIT
jgi:hypothetical protein